jgi:HNH endonuclease
MERVNQDEDCWVYTGKSTKNGYSGVGVGGRWVYGHRLSWEHEYGPIPDGMRIHHECENPLCVRPEHLTVVTASQHAASHGLGHGPCKKCGCNDWFYPNDRARQCRECRRRRRQQKKAICPQCNAEFNGESKTCSPRCGTLFFNATNPRDEPPHGTIQRYRRAAFKCRCELCRAANTALERKRKSAC